MVKKHSFAYVNGCFLLFIHFIEERVRQGRAEQKTPETLRFPGQSYA